MRFVIPRTASRLERAGALNALLVGAPRANASAGSPSAQPEGAPGKSLRIEADSLSREQSQEGRNVSRGGQLCRGSG